MPQQINSKLIIYIFLFILLGSLNNKNFIDSKFPTIKNIEVLGLNDEERNILIKKLFFLKKKNLFSINKEDIKNIIESNKIIEKYNIYKEYPSSLKIFIFKTKILANINKDGKNFYLGSNGNIIPIEKKIDNLPYIFGDFKNEDFFRLKEIIDNSKFEFSSIDKILYFKSGRWDLEIHPGILIKLPKIELEKSFRLLEDIIKHDEFKNTKIIDLRQLNQVIINE